VDGPVGGSLLTLERKKKSRRKGKYMLETRRDNGRGTTNTSGMTDHETKLLGQQFTTDSSGGEKSVQGKNEQGELEGSSPSLLGQIKAGLFMVRWVW